MWIEAQFVLQDADVYIHKMFYSKLSEGPVPCGGGGELIELEITAFNLEPIINEWPHLTRIVQENVCIHQGLNVHCRHPNVLQC